MPNEPKILTQKEMDSHNFRCEKQRLIDRAAGIVKSLCDIPEHENRNQMDGVIKDIAFLQLSTIMFSKRNKM